MPFLAVYGCNKLLWKICVSYGNDELQQTQVTTSEHPVSFPSKSWHEFYGTSLLVMQKYFITNAFKIFSTLTEMKAHLSDTFSIDTNIVETGVQFTFNEIKNIHDVD